MIGLLGMDKRTRRSLGRTVATTIRALGALAAVTACLAFAEQRRPAAVEAVTELDLARYAGLWYEIARLPNTFQDSCACCVTASYAPREVGRLTVVNECQTAQGTRKQAEGEAKLAAKDGPASKLKVRFAPRFLSFLGFVWGDYWVLDLAEDYSYALVGSPNRKYLWVLARQPTLEATTYAGILKKAGSMGFDVTRVVRTPQELD